MNQAERRKLREALIRARYRRVGATRALTPGVYTEQWERTEKGVPVSTVLIDWKKAPK